MAVRIMASVGAALFIVGILLTCATMFFADISWREVTDVLEESPLRVDVRSVDRGWRRGLGFLRSDDGPLKIYIGNREITIDW